MTDWKVSSCQSVGMLPFLRKETKYTGDRKEGEGACEAARQVRVLVAKPDDGIEIPRSHVVEVGH